MQLSKTCTHCQSGLTAVKLAQSEGHQDVYDILLKYTQQGSKVTSPEPGEIESRQEEERKVWMTDRNGIRIISFTLIYSGAERE